MKRLSSAVLCIGLSALLQGMAQAAIFGDGNPENGFELVHPNLEDVFISKINTSNVLV